MKPTTKHGMFYRSSEQQPIHTMLFIDEEERWVSLEFTYGPYTIEELVDTALSFHISTLWILDRDTYTVPPNYAEYSFQKIERHKKVAAVSVWKRGTGHINIIFPHNTAWAGLFADVAPRELLVAIAYVEKVLGLSVTSSPGSIGFGLIKKLHPEWIESIEFDWRAAHFTASAGADMVWQHPDLKEATKKRYIHKFDRNSAYPYAGAQTEIGAGVPVYLGAKDARNASLHFKGHPQAVGVFHCTVEYMDVDRSLPPAWTEHKEAGYEGWLAGPIVRLLVAKGHNIWVNEGFVFPERHQLLAKWATILWDSRQALNNRDIYRRVECAALAQSMIKLIANSTIGFTAFRGFDDDDEKRRPDIRLQVVARQRELLKHNIDKVYEVHAKWPVMAYMDALYYVSDLEEGFDAIPHFGIRQALPGGFKWEGRIEISPDVA